MHRELRQIPKKGCNYQQSFHHYSDFIQTLNDNADAMRQSPIPFSNLLDPNNQEEDSWLGSNPAKIAGWVEQGFANYTSVVDFEKINQKIAEMIENEGEVYCRQPVGYAPIIPAYLNGEPYAMYGKRYEEYRGPVKVIFNPIASAGFSGQSLIARSEAVMSLVENLQRIRPVELWITYGLDADAPWEAGSTLPPDFKERAPLPHQRDGHNACTIRVHAGITPISLSETLLLIHPGFVRSWIFNWATFTERFGGLWPFGGDEGLEEVLNEDMIEPEDLIFGGMHFDHAFNTEEFVLHWFEKCLKKHKEEVSDQQWL